MSEIIDSVFRRIWWEYRPAGGDWFNAVYHWFNLLEGGDWLLFAGLVLIRYVRFRNSLSELWYALAFATFAVSDFCEAWEQSSWLIWLNLLNLVALISLRRRIMSKYYPESVLY